MQISNLENFLNKDQFTQDIEDIKLYSKDWTKHLTPNATAIVFPKSIQDVQNLVKWARKENFSLVPSGGRTGMSGAAMATKGEIIVSLEKFNKILDFNPIDKIITCEPGVITEQIQKYAESKGLYYPVDFAARGSSHIAGNVATNAGGIKVIRYGLTRNWIAGLTVVTGTGDILKLNNGLVKNATGYDLRHLFIGSEGTLGIICEVLVSLTKQPKESKVMILAVNKLEDVINIYQLFTEILQINAFEMFTDLALNCVLEQGQLQNPFTENVPYYLLIETEVENENTEDKLMETFEICLENNWCSDGTLSQNDQQAQDFWRLREDISEATAKYSPYKNDISVKVSNVTEFLNELDHLIKNQYPEFKVVWFGHIGDGNLHVNILKPQDWSIDKFAEKCKMVDQEMFKMIKKFGGSISAEHGVGLTKKPFLSFTRSSEEIQIMKQIKSVFDPDGILNPGKIFD